MRLNRKKVPNADVTSEKNKKITMTTIESEVAIQQQQQHFPTSIIATTNSQELPSTICTLYPNHDSCFYHKPLHHHKEEITYTNGTKPHTPPPLRQQHDYDDDEVYFCNYYMVHGIYENSCCPMNEFLKQPITIMMDSPSSIFMLAFGILFALVIILFSSAIALEVLLHHHDSSSYILIDSNHSRNMNNNKNFYDLFPINIFNTNLYNLYTNNHIYNITTGKGEEPLFVLLLLVLLYKGS